jgi:mannose-1-phosphate guanylyltransferase
MLEECFLRIAPLTDPAKILVIINVRHRSLIRTILGDRGIQIVEEPYGRNTAPCIGLGCIHVLKNFGDLPIIALPADHYISGESEFRGCLRQGIALLKEGGIVTVGITPTHPETGYGYIERGPALGRGQAYRVNRFVEKPDLETARTYLAGQNYLWNAGIFLFRPSTMLRQIDTHLPRTGEALHRILEAVDTNRYLSTVEEAYRDMESISIDYGVMEKTDEPVYVIKGDFAWSDVGNWDAVRKLREAERDKDGNIVSGKTLLLDTSNTFVHSQTSRLIAVLGLENLLVVDTEDVLLLADLGQSQEVRRFPEKVREEGWPQFL